MQSTAPQIPVVGHDHFRLNFMHSQDAIVLLDADANRIVEANPRAAEILGYDLEELLLTPVSTIHPDEMARLRRFAAGVMANASGWTDELTCTTRSCDRIPAEISASAVEVDGRVLVRAMIRDITARRRADAEKELLVGRERPARRYAEERQALLERESAWPSPLAIVAQSGRAAGAITRNPQQRHVRLCEIFTGECQ